jgi:hypothetical protein
MSIKSFFTGLGKLLRKAANLAVEVGISDELLDLALSWVRVASTSFTDNAERREFVVKMLTSKGIPESVARLAVELAVQLFKAELAKAEDRFQE